MNTKHLKLIPFFLMSAFLFLGCTQKAKYDRKLKQELASGLRNDTLFMGIYFGMGQKEFYTHCWKLNQKGLIKQGLRNTTVEHILKDELQYPATMNFYPEFAQTKIFEMPVRFVYNGWAPWNTKLSSDSLQVQVLKWYEKQYGKGFMEVKHPKRGIAYVKLDGNRRISIFKENETYVWAIYTDMLVDRKLKDVNPNARNIPESVLKSLKK
ncbi:MAG: hypothetical protein Q8S54_16310 [Bacteroidota bacterium]|nr:hypothetical protein [Bacteroidota bacterium]